MEHTELSRRGGEAVLGKYGPEHFRELAKRGGSASGTARRGGRLKRTLHLTPELATALDQLCAARGLTMDTLFVEAVTLWLARLPGSGGGE